VSAIGDSELMTIKKSFEFGIADRVNVGMDDREAVGTSPERRWTQSKTI